MTLDEYVSGMRNKRVAVIGIGISNKPLIELLLRGGCDITICDKRPREAFGEELGEFEALGAKPRLGETYLDGLDFDVIFRTPGMHPDIPALREAKAKGAVVTTEMEAFFALCPCRTICVTGSDGKTTTTTITAKLLEAEGYTVHLGGNIGRPLLADVPKISPDDFAVLELSSFQLHSMYCHPGTAVITNVSPNHLDVHPSFEDYVDAKRMIYLNQEKCDRLVLNADDKLSADFAADAKSDVLYFGRRNSVSDGFFLRGGTIYRAVGGAAEAFLYESDIMIPGAHNRENYMAAFAATDGLVSRETCRSVARSFAGVPHRLEVIRTVNGVTFCNDSIASSPTRTIAGLRSFDRKTILIAGGYDKKIPFGELGSEIAKSVKALFLTGHTAEKIRDAVTKAPEYDPASLPVTVTEGFKEAVIAAYRMAKEGDIVLLSPACASFDKFLNFEQRGDTFREIVNRLE
jgi:UDP-N-acetylmuramoylalanine--D-glutamate ligase